MDHLGSSFNTDRKAIESAEDRGFDAGRDYGIELGIRLAIELLERHGHTLGAQRLREAKMMERTGK